MNYNYLFTFLLLSASFSGQFINGARTFPDQLPLSYPLDPDQNRPMGRCNANLDCPPGSNCNAFGTCE